MRALILSDIHANLEALNAVLDAAAGTFDTVWNLGDMVGYGASPNQVIDIIRPLASLHVRGNHDRVCCGLTSALGFNPIARAAAMWTQEELTPTNLNWLRGLPSGPLQPADPCLLAHPDKPEIPDVTCAHGSPLNEDHYILNMRDAWAPLQQATSTITFFGHTHIQGGFSQKEHDWHELRPRYMTQNDRDAWTLTIPPGTRHLINPGSIGQPRDADWRAAYALYDTGICDTEATHPRDEKAEAPPPDHTVTFHRVPYDLTASQGRILMAGLPERLAARLREGR